MRLVAYADVDRSCSHRAGRATLLSMVAAGTARH